MKTLTITEAESYQLRTVLNQALKDGRGSINGVSARLVGGEMSITVEDEHEKPKYDEAELDEVIKKGTKAWAGASVDEIGEGNL